MGLSLAQHMLSMVAAAAVLCEAACFSQAVCVVSASSVAECASVLCGHTSWAQSPAMLSECSRPQFRRRMFCLIPLWFLNTAHSVKHVCDQWWTVVLVFYHCGPLLSNADRKHCASQRHVQQ